MTYGGLSFSMGGAGGVAGNGSTVTVTSDANITTAGQGSDAIKAQSIGGGGGNGTFSISGTLSLASGAGVAVAVGGTGGAGGSAADVNVSNSGTIRTGGDRSRGISALSQGGGGGHAGLTIAGSISSGAGGISLAVGQAGGRGGAGGNVTVSNSGAIITERDQAVGIEAMSVGGNGGRGSISFAASASGPDSLDIGVAVGGDGGTAGDGGTVHVTNSGTIATGTPGDPIFDAESITHAHGIFAQSVGGGGGSGGLSGSLSTQPQGSGAPVNVTVAVGGNGGSGARGGEVKVANSGAISTVNDASHAIFAESVGGSGGAAGSGFAVSFELTSSQNAGVYNLAFAVGGKGGDGSTGGDVTVTNSLATLATGGNHAHGIYAHSVGGSGGSGGSARTMAYTFNPAFRPPSNEAGDGFNLQVGIGGNGGTGTHGGRVEVDNSGTIQTQGDGAYGIFAYSIGGGGGDGGGSAGLTNIPFTDRVKFYKSVKIEVGGDAGSSGDGGDVTVTHTAGDLITQGQAAPALVAQSVGGGGGTGGTGAAGATGTVAVGGRGGAAGDGGDVTVAFSGGSISTSGAGTASADPSQDIDSSYGILAQSVGGGGGVAGNATFFGLPAATPVVGQPLSGITLGVGIGIDLAGGNAGDGGAVSVNATGNITTRGPNAVGIFAQSVGGGGGISGNLGFSPLSEQALIGSVGGNGKGGTVEVTYVGNLATFGGGAHGILAQSAGGTGADTVAVDVTGSVVANGVDAAGILAQSVKLDDTLSGMQGAAAINVTIADGSVVQGGTPGENNLAPGVWIEAGTSNFMITGAAMLSNARALAGDMTGHAIVATTGDDFVVNNGAILGSVALGGGTNKLNNNGSGRFYSGAVLDLGAGNPFTNFGLLSPGGDAVLQTTTLTGNLVQSGGTYLVTLDASGADLNDRVDVSGTTDMTGSVQVEVIDAGTGTVQRQTTVIQSTGGVSAATASNLTVTPSAVGNYGLVFTNPQTIDLTYAIDFASPTLARGLNENQDALATYLERLHTLGSVHRELLFLLGAEDTRAYGALLEGLSPEAYAVTSWAAALSAQRFADGLLSCREREGDQRFIREGQCYRLGLQGRRFNRDGSHQDVGYDIDSGEVALGAQLALAARWQIGLGAAYETWQARADGDLWRSNGDQGQAGVALKYQIGATALSAALNGGLGKLDVRRRATPGASAEGDQNAAFVGGQLRAAHAIELGRWYVKPRTDLSATWVHTDDLEESGAGAAALDVADDRQTYLALQPTVEVGAEIATVDGWLLRPRLALGLTRYLTDPSPTAQARFAAAPAAPSFAATSHVERTWVDLEIGLDVLSAGGVVLGLNGIGQIANGASHAAAEIRLSVPF